MPTAKRHTRHVDQRVDQRVVRLVTAAESFSFRFGAELAEAQAAMSAMEFARFIELLGIGRTKADRFMELARLATVEIDELRPSAWVLMFGRLEPFPLLPGEMDPLIEEIVVAAEPATYRRRADLLSADGLIYMMVAMHRPEAISAHAAQSLTQWLAGEDDGGEALGVVRSWRVNADECRQEPHEDGTREGMSTAQEADPR